MVLLSFGVKLKIHYLEFLLYFHPKVHVFTLVIWPFIVPPYLCSDKGISPLLYVCRLCEGSYSPVLLLLSWSCPHLGLLLYSGPAHKSAG